MYIIKLPIWIKKLLRYDLRLKLFFGFLFLQQVRACFIYKLNFEQPIIQILSCVFKASNESGRKDPQNILMLIQCNKRIILTMTLFNKKKNACSFKLWLQNAAALLIPSCFLFLNGMNCGFRRSFSILWFNNFQPNLSKDFLKINFSSHNFECC